MATGVRPFELQVNNNPGLGKNSRSSSRVQKRTEHPEYSCGYSAAIEDRSSDTKLISGVICTGAFGYRPSEPSTGKNLIAQVLVDIHLQNPPPETILVKLHNEDTILM